MKIALIGYGKMGHAIEEAALSRGHEIVCRIDKDNQEDFDSVSFKSADVAIEFTAPSVAVDNYRRAFAAGVPVVSGARPARKARLFSMPRISVWELISSLPLTNIWQVS